MLVGLVPIRNFAIVDEQRGLFVVKVMQNGKVTSLGEPFETKKEAIETFNNYNK